MTYNLITDGSVLAYASCGGWAFLLQGAGNEKQRSGILWEAHSNIVELWAIVEGLSIIPKPSDVFVFTDSYYVIRGFSKGRYEHDALWRELYLLAVIHNITFVKVGKGKSDKRHTKIHHLAREQVFNAVQQSGIPQSRPYLSARRLRTEQFSNLRKSKRRACRWIEPDLEDAG